MKNTDTIIANVLVDNNRFATHKVKADQLDAEIFRNWKNGIEAIRKAAYAVYAECENAGLDVKHADTDLTAVYNALKPVLKMVGHVNGHYLAIHQQLAICAVTYAGKRANADSPELQLACSMLRNRQKELTQYEKTNGVRPETLEKLRAEIAELEDKKAQLIAEPDNRIKTPTRTSAEAFRLDFEHRLARFIAEQQAKTWEELEAEAQARKQAKKDAKKSAK